MIPAKTHLGSFIKRLITRAVNNPIFENNQKGDYTIKPQHGANVFKYILQKKDEVLAEFEILPEGKIFGDYRNASKKEQTAILETLKTLYPKFQIIFREK